MYIYQTMSNNFGYIDIILLAMIAGFIILRLRNILGRKTGHQDKVFSGFEDNKFESFKKESTVVKKENDNELTGSDKDKFLNGAALAYESIIIAFANEDKKKLQELLSKEMSANFNQAIDQRNLDNIKSELTFVGMKESKLED